MRLQAAHLVLESKETPQDRYRCAYGPGDGSKRKKEFLVDQILFVSGWCVRRRSLLKIALGRKLLEIVSAYLGLWPRLHSIGAWLNFPTDAPPELFRS